MPSRRGAQPHPPYSLGARLAVMAALHQRKRFLTRNANDSSRLIGDAMRAAFLFALLFAAFAGQASAQTATQLMAIHRAATTGLALYQHDRAAWVATDAMLAIAPNPDVRGWITTQRGDAIEVTFVRVAGDAPMAAYRAIVRDGRVASFGPAERPLDATEITLYRAVALARTADLQRCSDNLNTVTLPGETQDEIAVYVMPGTTDPSLVQFGGFNRVSVNADGLSIRGITQFTRGCIESHTPAEARGEPAALFITQILTDTPTEVHVFTSLSSRLPVFVSTSAGIWEVDGERIRLVEARR